MTKMMKQRLVLEVEYDADKEIAAGFQINAPNNWDWSLAGVKNVNVISHDSPHKVVEIIGQPGAKREHKNDTEIVDKVATIVNDNEERQKTYATRNPQEDLEAYSRIEQTLRGFNLTKDR